MFALALPVALVSIHGEDLAALPPPPGPRPPPTEEEAAIERQPVCIGSAVESAGTLSDVLYYRAVAQAGGRVAVGYYVFFSEERPWGNNWLTWSVLPALAVDLVYSRALLVAPGLQRAIYGAGDVEGVGIVYDPAPDGSLRIDHAFADDRSERVIALSRDDVFALDPRRPTFYTEVWSHQLGGRGAKTRKDLAYLHCYEGPGSIRPLPESIASAFRVAGRAAPAHVERIPGARVD